MENDELKNAGRQVLRYVSAGLDADLLILPGSTVVKEYGYVFFYQTRAFVETGDIRQMMAGNAPIVYLKHDQSLHPLGTHAPFEDLLEEFERERGLD